MDMRMGTVIGTWESRGRKVFGNYLGIWDRIGAEVHRSWDGMEIPSFKVLGNNAR